MRISIFTLVVVAFTLAVVYCDEGKPPAALSPVVPSDLKESPIKKTDMKPSRAHRLVRPKSDRIQTREMKIRRGPKPRGKLNSSPRSHPARKPVEIAKQSPKDDGHIYRYIRQAKPSKTKKPKKSIKKTLSSAAKKTKEVQGNL